jgi:hypothetical protein
MVYTYNLFINNSKIFKPIEHERFKRWNWLVLLKKEIERKQEMAVRAKTLIISICIFLTVFGLTFVEPLRYFIGQFPYLFAFIFFGGLIFAFSDFESYEERINRLLWESENQTQIMEHKRRISKSIPEIKHEGFIYLMKSYRQAVSDQNLTKILDLQLELNQQLITLETEQIFTSEEILSFKENIRILGESFAHIQEEKINLLKSYLNDRRFSEAYHEFGLQSIENTLYRNSFEQSMFNLYSTNYSCYQDLAKIKELSQEKDWVSMINKFYEVKHQFFDTILKHLLVVSLHNFFDEIDLIIRELEEIQMSIFTEKKQIINQHLENKEINLAQKLIQDLKLMAVNFNNTAELSELQWLEQNNIF